MILKVILLSIACILFLGIIFAIAFAASFVEVVDDAEKIEADELKDR